eukprot:TRINITY_DN102992_c0_g1_i1.p2 TRINITY_DN102992_c0_g1~~TRINITY_DN102992_c0_g1_i1.p2  ORF type:complete len:143 (-),score=24.95 TRINITY_DN102992_c0_g1_i1:487-915(-)
MGGSESKNVKQGAARFKTESVEQNCMVCEARSSQIAQGLQVSFKTKDGSTDTTFSKKTFKETEDGAYGTVPWVAVGSKRPPELAVGDTEYEVKGKVLSMALRIVDSKPPELMMLLVATKDDKILLKECRVDTGETQRESDYL